MEIKENASSSSSSLTPVVIAIILCVLGYGFFNGSISKPKAQTTQAQTQSISTPHYHAPVDAMSIYGSATITADQINAILAAYHSPAAGTGSYLYNSALQYGIDPIMPLAFFMHESTLGTQGEATATLALGNERCITDRPCIDTDRGGYAQFNSWQDGYQHWFDLITGPIYKGAGLTTVQSIIPVYAPTADHNDEQAYINALIYSIQAWRSGKVVI